MANKPVETYSLFTDYDIHLFKEGKHFDLYNKFGCHTVSRSGQNGKYFALWAPNAKKVSVKSDFNGWNPDTHNLIQRSDGSGIWEGFVAGVKDEIRYKYHII